MLDPFELLHDYAGPSDGSGGQTGGGPAFSVQGMLIAFGFGVLSGAVGLLVIENALLRRGKGGGE